MNAITHDSAHSSLDGVINYWREGPAEPPQSGEASRHEVRFTFDELALI